MYDIFSSDLSSACVRLLLDDDDSEGADEFDVDDVSYGTETFIS